MQHVDEEGGNRKEEQRAPPDGAASGHWAPLQNLQCYTHIHTLCFLLPACCMATLLPSSSFPYITICPETITELICFRFLRCKITLRPEKKKKKTGAEFARDYGTEITWIACKNYSAQTQFQNNFCDVIFTSRRPKINCSKITCHNAIDLGQMVRMPPACYTDPRWLDPEFPREIPQRVPPSPKFWNPEDIPRTHQKNAQRGHFWVFFRARIPNRGYFSGILGILGVLSGGSRF